MTLARQTHKAATPPPKEDNRPMWRAIESWRGQEANPDGQNPAPTGPGKGWDVDGTDLMTTANILACMRRTRKGIAAFQGCLVASMTDR